MSLKKQDSLSKRMKRKAAEVYSRLMTTGGHGASWNDGGDLIIEDGTDAVERCIGLPDEAEEAPKAQGL